MSAHTIPRISVVGAGSWSTEMHLPSMKKLAAEGAVTYTGICDLDETCARTYAAKLGVDHVFTDLEEMIHATSPDGLDIIVTPDIPRTPVDIAIEHRIPFLVEKPPAPDTDAHLRYLKNLNGLLHTVAYNRRYAPFTRIVHNWLEAEDIYAVSVHFTRFRRTEQHFANTAVHSIDTARSLAGDNLTDIHIDVSRGTDALNYVLHGTTESGTRISIMIMPDTARAQEFYYIVSRNRSVTYSFPQPGCIDTTGCVELYEDNELKKRITGDDLDFTGDSSEERSFRTGIEDEHRVFYSLVQGNNARPVTLQQVFQTQVIREKLIQIEEQGEPCRVSLSEELMGKGET